MTTLKNRKFRVLPDPVSNLSFLHILNDGFLASFPLLLPFIQKDLDMGFGTVGFLSSVLASAGAVLALPSSLIARRFGGYRVLRIALLIYAAAFILTGFSPGFIVLVFSFLMASLGFGLFHPISFALVARGGDGKNVGRRMGNFTAIGDFGRIGIAAFATVLIASLGWRTTAIVYGVLPLSLFAFSKAFCQPPVPTATVENVNAGMQLRGLRYSKEFILAIATGSIDALASTSLFIFIPFLLIHRGIPVALLGSLSGAFFVGNMLGKVMIGKIIDRLGCYRVFVSSEIIMAALLVVLSVEKSTVLIAVLSVLLGAVTKGTVPIINTMVANAVPDRQLYEKAFGIVSFASGLAAVAAPVIFGFVAERFGVVSVFRVSAIIALLAIVPGLAHAMVKRFAQGKARK